ncbi:hypothetical protein HNY73_005719 [Argiope bruennichi]|uniref:Uncharacterized protein n=1 Tax=Argiope bruennichi TaxID=94029 RepID=A0A8T0FHJ7_ARGBR|nr:hypothetical protein HNY73_005719 [Argiope bruennichi]
MTHVQVDMFQYPNRQRSNHFVASSCQRSSLQLNAAQSCLARLGFPVKMQEAQEDEDFIAKLTFNEDSIYART